MKILHVITSLDTGGAERLMVDLLPLLREKGNEVELLLFNGEETLFKKELERKGIIIHDLPLAGKINRLLGGVYNPFIVFKIRPFLKDYDIIHTHNTACQLYVPISKRIFVGNTRLITTEHNSTNRRRTLGWFKPIDRWMYKQYLYIICIADQTRINLENYIGLSNRIKTIYNGVDISKFIKPINNILGKENFVITMVAAFRSQKDQDTLVKAMLHLPRQYRLQFVGIGERIKHVEAMCMNLSLSDRVSFLGLRTDVTDILEKSDVIVLSSHWEGLSLSSIEGMASGRAFIASDVDGLREMVGGAGVLFPQGDDKVLADKIQWLCEHPEEYREVAKRCQERAKLYDITVMAENYNNLYKSIDR